MACTGRSVSNGLARARRGTSHRATPQAILSAGHLRCGLAPVKPIWAPPELPQTRPCKGDVLAALCQFGPHLAMPASWGNSIPASRTLPLRLGSIRPSTIGSMTMALFVGLDISLKTTSICIVQSNGAWRVSMHTVSNLHSTKAPYSHSESGHASIPISLIFSQGRERFDQRHWFVRRLAFPNHLAQWFLSSRPNKTDRSNARSAQVASTLSTVRPMCSSPKEGKVGADPVGSLGCAGAISTV